ncbi:MAG: bifunctional ADP-dependent NAD(P)H-hydrate dehydratase/NAD(P)H-hydrate epimerase [Sphingobacteriaceae bacterium]|nr:bifunctional ADP-dependent NAD(P)H-hydrate dehydratase/NAD(P)H-hydrate epimerase [Sphingobacteriaceae bacterium]
MISVLHSDTFKKADAHTLEKRGISSAELMEDAAMACARWFTAHYPKTTAILVVAGHGNNGGDGLAIARLLQEEGYFLRVFRMPSRKYSHDHLVNAAKLPENVFLSESEFKERMHQYNLIIDALLGLGTNRKADGTYAKTIKTIQEHAWCPIVSIDLPSGMPAELPFDDSWPVVKATSTLCLSAWKLNLLLPAGGVLAGKINILPFGLDFDFGPQKTLASWYRPGSYLPRIPYRRTFAHKGEFGHALIIAGSDGMWGAGLLAAEASMRLGAGKTTLAGPHDLRTALAVRLPEAMFVRSGELFWDTALKTEGYTAIGVGPGLGQSPLSWEVLKQLIQSAQAPLVLDADALNVLAQSPAWLKKLPRNSVITPHMGEFDRLFGPHEHWWARLVTAGAWVQKHRINIVLKGAHTFTFTNGNPIPLVNTTGNAGLAKAGTGDVLTGIITSYIAQGMDPEEAAPLGVYVHGLAADLAVRRHPRMSLMASDLFDTLGQAARKAYQAFSELSPPKSSHLPPLEFFDE